MIKRDLPTEALDENGEPISLVDKDGEPIKELAFLASVSHGGERTEEERLKKQNRKLLIMAICFFMAFISFFGLYIMERNKYIEKCQTFYNEALTDSITLMEKSLKTEFDFETNYRELCGELNVLRKTTFAVIEEQEEQNTINEIYSMSIKLPKEYKKYLEEIYSGFKYLKDGQNDKGYSTLDAVLKKTDLLNYGSDADIKVQSDNNKGAD